MPSPQLLWIFKWHQIITFLKTLSVLQLNYYNHANGDNRENSDCSSHCGKNAIPTISEVLFNDLKSIPLPLNTLNVFPAMRLQLGSMLNKIGLCTDILSQLHILHGGPHCLFFISQHYLFWNIDTFLLLLSIFHWCLSYTLQSREYSLSSF